MLIMGRIDLKFKINGNTTTKLAVFGGIFIYLFLYFFIMHSCFLLFLL